MVEHNKQQVPASNKKQASILSFFKAQDSKNNKRMSNEINIKKDVRNEFGDNTYSNGLDDNKNVEYGSCLDMKAKVNRVDNFFTSNNIIDRENNFNKINASKMLDMISAHQYNDQGSNKMINNVTNNNVSITGGTCFNEGINEHNINKFMNSNTTISTNISNENYEINKKRNDINTDLDNLDESTEDDIIIKKKRKIVLDSSIEDINDNDNNNNDNNNNDNNNNNNIMIKSIGNNNNVASQNNNDKLRNLIYNANDSIPETLFEDKNKAENISYIRNRKESDSKKSQELDVIKNKFLNLPITLTNDKFRLYIEQYFIYCNTFEFPKWIQPQHIRDKNLNTPESPDYDCTTMWTPPPNHEWAIEYKQAHYTPGMQQFWSIKSKNFDKIIFFKMGRFYEIFYIDACFMHTCCGLNWMGGEQKPHLGFPEQSLHMYAKKVINSGHKVVVIEQMETPKELEQRNKESVGPKEKAIKRDINEIYTKGTLLHDSMLNSETKYIVCFYFDEVESLNDTNDVLKTKCNFGFVVSDIATAYVALGYCTDDESRIQLRTILAQLCPAEILYCSKNINKEVLSIFKNMPASPELTGVNTFPNIIAALDEVNKYFETLPKPVEFYQEQNSVMCALGGFIIYLRSLLLDKKILKFCKLEMYDLFKKDNYMILDATALNHLEILETQSGEVKNSLYDYVNKTCTNFGARNMRRWICSPLLDCDKINERLDVVTFLKNNEHILSLIRIKMKKLPDIERLLNKICIQASQSERGAVFFDNIVNTKLKEFVTFLNAFKEIDNILNEINTIDKDDEFLPKRLFEITNTIGVVSTGNTDKQQYTGFYPNISDITNQLLERIDYDGEKEYKPAAGFDNDIDIISQKEKEIEEKLHNILGNIKKTLKIPSLKYVHAKYKYEIECPDNIPKSFLNSVEITSAKKGFVRFHTDDIKSCIEVLDDIEQEKKDA
uniref:DNA mismatch repair protein MutS core domain-containing protein n=1 Tax=Piliocolobus tephrosceles TaxID=591936 RepID=A0A8C9GY89_9PRIM